MINVTQDTNTKHKVAQALNGGVDTFREYHKNATIESLWQSFKEVLIKTEQEQNRKPWMSRFSCGRTREGSTKLGTKMHTKK